MPTVPAIARFLRLGLAMIGAALALSGQQILRLGNGTEPQDLDPQAVTGLPEHKILMALFEGLLSTDATGQKLEPGIAESWDISPDGLVYTFHLRKDAQWSDGTPLTSADYIQSYRRMLTPELGAEYAYLIFNFVAGAREYYRGEITDFDHVGFKAPDPHTLQVTLKQPTPFLLSIIASHYAWYAVPVHVISKFGPTDRKNTPWTRPGRLVGNGPFVLKEWLPNQRIEVVRNPRYWDAARVKLDEVHFYATEDIAAEERMFRTGQLDITYELPNSKIDVYRRERPESLQTTPYLGVYFYRCNVTRPPLNDKRIRRALALAVNRDTLVKRVLRGGQSPAYAMSHPDCAGYSAQAQLTEDIAEAKRLLAEAGYPGGKGLPPIELLYNTSENHRAIAETLQAMWRKNLGVDVRLTNQEWKVYLDSQHTMNFQLQRSGWIADYIDPHVFFELWETDNGNNNSGWSNPEYDRLLHEALRTADTAARYAIYQKLDAILIDELPAIPLYYYSKTNAMHPRVKGYLPTPLDGHPYKYISIQD